MFGAMLTVIKTVGSSLISKTNGPVQIGGDDQIQMIKTPMGPVNVLFDVINRIIRPGLVFLVLWMFYWFAINPELASKWIEIVAKIPGPMWDNIMIIMSSIGLTSVIRSAKTPYTGPNMVVKTPPGDGAVKPPSEHEPDEVEPAPAPPAVNPTLAAWKEKAKANAN